jgi:hypothetical protein
VSTDTVEFTITKGLENTFLFTVKANGSTLPITIVAGDTFEARLVVLSTLETVLTKALTVTDADNGQVTLVLSSADTSTLVSERGSKVDRYYLRPMYKLILDCVTAQNGNFLATVQEVYVD